MTRFQAAFWQDLRLQRRYGFYYAAIVVTLVWTALLFSLPDDAKKQALPLIIFADLATVGYFFIAGMVLFEKSERTLLALLVSPLRFGEYLAARLSSLTLLALALSLLVPLLSYGFQFNWLLLIIGTISVSIVIMLVGFIVVVRYRTISDYLIPASLWLSLLGLPLFYYAGWLRWPVFYLLPTQGSMVLIGGAFAGITAPDLLYAILNQLVWIILLLPLARRAYDKHIVAHPEQ